MGKKLKWNIKMKIKMIFGLTDLLQDSVLDNS